MSRKESCESKALFVVSTDYLLKDEFENEIYTEDGGSGVEEVRTVSLEEANTYIEFVHTRSKQFAFAVMLCVLSPVLLVFYQDFRRRNILSQKKWQQESAAPFF